MDAPKQAEVALHVVHEGVQAEADGVVVDVEQKAVLPQGRNENSQIFFQKVAKFAKKFFTT